MNSGSRGARRRRFRHLIAFLLIPRRESNGIPRQDYGIICGREQRLETSCGAKSCARAIFLIIRRSVLLLGATFHGGHRGGHVRHFGHRCSYRRSIPRPGSLGYDRACRETHYCEERQKAREKNANIHYPDVAQKLSNGELAERLINNEGASSINRFLCDLPCWDGIVSPETHPYPPPRFCGYSLAIGRCGAAGPHHAGGA